MFLRRKKPSSAPPMVIRGRRAVTKNLRRTKQGPCWPWAQHDSMSWFDALGENVDDLLPFSGHLLMNHFLRNTWVGDCRLSRVLKSLCERHIPCEACVFLLVECVAPKVVTDIRSACKLLARSRRTPPCLMSWVPTQPTPQSYTLWIFCIAHVHLFQGQCLFMFVQYGWEGWAFVQCVCPWCKSHHGSSDAPVQGYDFLHMFWSIAAKNQIPDGKTRSAAEMSKLLVRMQPKKHSNTSLSQPFHFHALCGIMY